VRPKDPSGRDRVERLRSGGDIWIGRAQIYTRTRSSASRGRQGGEFEVALATLSPGPLVWHGRRGTRIFVRMDLRRIRRLRNPIRNYAWGSHTAIAELLGEASPSEQPQAELWIGAHPGAPSWVETDEGEVPLDAYIARDPVAVLGADVAARFGGKLPFLMKILAAERPLSLQAHPNLQQARAGFARENAAGIPLDAPERCYKDPNHKPELICALTPFHALCRFRMIGEIVHLFEELDAPELAHDVTRLRDSATRDALAHFFANLITSDPATKSSLVARAESAAPRHSGSNDAWAWVARLAEAYPDDLGALAPLYLNIVTLEPGEALYLRAGELHSYLDGVGIELMASSDNVLRGGLTHKHVDTEELLAVLTFDVGIGSILRPDSVDSIDEIYVTPGDDFSFSALHLVPGRSIQREPGRIVEILLCTEGEAEIECVAPTNSLTVRKGQSVLVPAAASAYRIRGRAHINRATVGPAQPSLREM
jgi:mannose-6-phosphate isomerase